MDKEKNQNNNLLNDTPDPKNTIKMLSQRLAGRRVNLYANLPDSNSYSLTPEIQARAVELATQEQSLLPRYRQGYLRILSQLLDGSIS